MAQFVNILPSDFTYDEIAAMAELLRRRHGPSATGVARGFAMEHEVYRDGTRAAAWWRVEALLTTCKQSPTEC
jgi:hypothetical protein